MNKETNLDRRTYIGLPYITRFGRRLTSAQKENMTSKRFRLCMFVFSALIIMVIIVVIAVITTRAIDNNKAEDNFLCDVNETVRLETSSEFHAPCSSSENIVESCRKVKDPAWRSFTPQSQEWRSVTQMIPDVDGNFSSIVISPFFVVLHESCSLHFSFGLETRTPIRAFILTSSNVTEKIIDTSESCGVHFIDHHDILTNYESRLRILIASSSEIATENANVTVTSQSCVRLEGLRLMGRAGKTEVKKISGGTRNTCSLEVVNRTLIGCDWLNVRDVDTADFERIDSHSCVETGVNHKPSDSWFLMLGPNPRGEPTAQALLASPILEGGISHVLISLWFMLKCNGPHLKIYLVPCEDNQPNLVGWYGGHKVAEVNNTGFSNGWQSRSYKVAVPSHYKNFQVVIEGIVPNGGSCLDHYCYVMDWMLVNATTPLLVLDDLVIESLNEECKPSGSKVPANIDCEFGTSDNKSTYCDWVASCPASPCVDVFREWKTRKLPDKGHVLSLNTFSGGGVKYFRSPLVVANSNCACALSFKYLIKAFAIPKLEVNLILGEDIGDKERQLDRQWWFHGLSTGEWMTSTITLNLWKSQPFQVELRAVVSDVAGVIEVHVDDFVFENCDISHY